MTIPIPPYTMPARVNTIASITHQDSNTHLFILEELRAQVNQLIELVNGEFDGNREFIAAAINSLIESVNARAAEWMGSQIENNDIITAQIVNDAESRTRAAVAELTTGDITRADSATRSAINAAVTVELNDALSAVRNALNAAIVAQVGSGQAKTVVHDGVAGELATIGTGIRGSFDAAMLHNLTAASTALANALDAQLAAKVAVPGSAVGGAVDARISSVASAIIASDPAIAAAATTAVQNAGVAAEVRWNRPAIAGIDLNTLTAPGIYPILTYTAANGLVNRPTLVEAVSTAYIEVVQSTATIVKQTWVTLPGPTAVAPILERRLSTGTWTAWERVDDKSKLLAAGANIHDLTPGENYYVNTYSAALNIVNAPTHYNPAIGPATIRVGGTVGMRIVVWTSANGPMLTKSLIPGIGWSKWQPVSVHGDLALPAVAPVAEDAHVAAFGAAMPVGGDPVHDPRRWRARAGVELVTPTHDGSGQATHPSVVYIPSGVSGYTYWMAMTPFPYGNDAHEDPNILASNNGTDWVVPAGLTNPLDELSGGSGNFNADTELHWDGTMFRLLWARPSNPGSGDGRNSIVMRTSTDGINWTPLTEILRSDIGDGVVLASPTLTKLNGEWWMHGVEIARTPNALVAYRSAVANPGPADWVKVACTVAPGLPPGREVWHLGVRRYDGAWWAILNDTTNQPGTDGRIYLMRSENGIDWINSPIPLIPQIGAAHNALYRPTFVCSGSLADQSLTFDIWYGGRRTTGVNWNLFRTKTVLPIAQPTDIMRNRYGVGSPVGSVNAVPGVQYVDTTSGTAWRMTNAGWVTI